MSNSGTITITARTLDLAREALAVIIMSCPFAIRPDTRWASA